MKKMIAMLLCCAMAFSFTACGSDDKGGNDTQQNVSDDAQQTGGGDQQGGQEQTGDNDQQGGGSQAEGDALAILTGIWDGFPEDGKFACVGGNINESAVQGAPGKFDLSDGNGLTYNLLIPEAVQPELDDVASLIHMMNANTFTGAVVHVNGGDVASVANGIKDQVLNNQFMCGFPDKLVVLLSGDYVLYAFGAEDLIDNFVSAAKANISDIAEAYNDFL